ncbi:hypothetical protein NKR23_g7777 [Pleurostoma richardsiae]|uniref:Extracellular membrane protein CFEM domain-containing protein n=1 Tax=Pleurostoma richardsiae TaxID=41990 RepID=A0AA38R9Q5_9PEZI|nr:hypothetical protein NKR23_g7777 [Pleurostoma richardsiae]
MAVRPPLSLILWFTTITFASAASFNLSADVTAFIPDCALACFESFLEANFAHNLCGDSPSLQCLCSHTGSSGFTIGEGAVQCIVAENTLGACKGMEATSQVVSSAYGMCNAQLSAAPETHATLVATLIVPTGTGPVLVPNPTSTIGSVSVTASETADTTTPITWITMTPDQSSSSTSTASTSSSQTPDPSIANASPASTQPSSSQSTKGQLSTAVIAGIVAGGTAAVLLAVLLILILRCTYRKKSLEDEKNGFSKLRESWSPRRKSGISPGMPQISAPQYQEPEPMEYTRALANRMSVRPETIGLAISPDGMDMPKSSTMALGSPPTYMSPKEPPQPPPKPNLTLTIPPKAEQGAGLQPPRMPFNGGRDSVVTEFAEDGEADPSSAGAAQIWRPPPSDPQSATTYYVADRWGNWILTNPTRRSQTAELAGLSPTARRRAEESQEPAAASAPAASDTAAPTGPPTRPGQARLAPPREPSTAGQSRSSSVYSNYSLPQSVAPGPRNPLPSNLPLEPEAYYYSGNPAQRRSSSIISAARRRSSRGGPQPRPDTAASHDSVTTIASSASGALDGEDDTAGYDFEMPGMTSNLSPVVESPQSAGHSPVTYPSIPRPRSKMFGGGRRAAAAAAAAAQGSQGADASASSMIRLFPPPVRYEYQPPGQPSPTLGLVDPVATAPSQPQYATGQRRPGLNPNPNRNPGQVRTGSPNMPQQQGDDPDRPQPLSLAARKPTPYQDRQAPATEADTAAYIAAFPPVGSSNSRQVDQQPQQQQPSTPVSIYSTTSSLLAKRVGSERAAALALAEQQGQQQRRGPSSKWTRQGGGEGDDSTDRSALPATPGWLPKLTPTRRGDELFLSVQ